MSPSPDHVADQVDDLVHGLVDGETAARIAAHCAGCPACLEALEAARQRLVTLRAEPPAEPPAPLIEDTAQKVRAKAAPRPRRWRAVLAAAATFLLAALALGSVHAYYASLKPSPADLVLLGQNEFFLDTDASVRLRLVNRNTGEPITGQPVTLTLSASPGAPPRATDLSSATLATDARGGAEPRFHVPDWPVGDYQLTARAGGETVVRSVRLVRSWQVLLSTDKPVYKPGQTILVRALALRQPDLKPVAGEPATFTITDPHGNVVFKHTAPTSRFGIAGVTRDGKEEKNVSCPLADETNEGTWTVACRVGATESKRTIEVFRYVLPKYKVEIKPNRTFYPDGGEVHLDVHATWFTGDKPVTDAKVKVKGRTPWGEELPPQETKTDAEGKVGVACKLPPLPGGEGQVRFEVSVDDGGPMPQTAAVDCLVSNRPVRIDVQPECGTLVEGVPNTVYFVVTQADGQPLPLQLSAEGLGILQCDAAGVASAIVTPKQRETRWTIRGLDVQGEVRVVQVVQLLAGDRADDFLLRTDKAVYHGGDEVKLTVLGGGNLPVFVDLNYTGMQRTTVLTETVPVANGRGQVKFTLPLDVTGTLELCAYRFTGDDGRWDAAARGRSDTTLRKTRLLCVQPAAQVQIRTTLSKPDKPEGYRPGDKARLDFHLLDAQGQPKPGALGLTAVDSAVYAVLAQRSGQERSFVGLNAEHLKPITDAAPGWVPGEQEQRDRALLARTAQTLPAPNSGNAPTLHTLTGESYSSKMTQTLQEQSNRLVWVQRGWVVLVLLTLVAGYLACLAWMTRLYLVIGHLFLGLYVLPIILFAGWVIYQKTGSNPVVAIFDASTSMSSREERQAETAMAPEWGGAFEGRTGAMRERLLANGGGNDRFDEGEFGTGGFRAKDADGKPGMPDRAGDVKSLDPAPRLRQYFPETLLWRPELVTDDAGHAWMELELPDSLTTWKLLATAVGADGQLGAAENSFRVFQPFFVDFDLPVALTRNDEVEIRVSVSNYLDHPQKVTLTLADLPGIERVGVQPAEQVVEVPAGGRQNVTYRLRARAVGTQKLEITARGEGVGDAVRREVEVLPDGWRFETAFNGTLSPGVAVTHDLVVPADAIDGSPRALVKIYPSSFSQLVEGLEGMFQMPHGCFEQTSSTTYPNVLALDYLRRSQQRKPAAEAKAQGYIHLGYQRLLSFEVPGGGFDWFGHAPANRTLTAYGLREFEAMARVHDVDPAVIARTRAWLLAQRQPNGSWVSDNRMHDDPLRGADAQLAATAYIAWAVFGSGKAVEERTATLNYLLAHRPADIRDIHALALVCNALLALDPTGAAARPYLDRLESRKETDPTGRFVFWRQDPGGRTLFHGAGRGGQVETTAMAVLALLHDPARAGSVRQALAWLADQKGSNGTWYSTQATVLALEALLEGTGKGLGGDGERRVVVQVDGKAVQTVTIPADKAEVLATVDLRDHLKAGQRTVVSLTEESATGAGYQVTLRYYQPGAAEKGAFDLALAYPAGPVRVGQSVPVTARLALPRPGTAPMVMLEVPVPAGFVLDADTTALLDKLVRERKIARYQVRPGWVEVYLTELRQGSAFELTYRLLAITPAQVTARGARAYEYYNPDQKAETAAVPLTVRQ